MYSLSTGTGNYLAQRIWKSLGLQTRCLRPGNLGRAFTCCVSEPDYRLALETGREAVSLLESVNDTALMPTIGQELDFGVQPAASGTGRKPLPERYLSPDDEFGIAPGFSDEMQKIVGSKEPLFRLT